MKLKVIENRLGLTCKCCWEKLDAEVTGGYVGDLLSDVMANSAQGQVWITRQVHLNVVAVAVLKEHAAIVMVQGARPDPDTLDKASKEGIPVLVTDMSAFETAGRLHRLLFPDRD